MADYLGKQVDFTKLQTRVRSCLLEMSEKMSMQAGSLSRFRILKRISRNSRNQAQASKEGSWPEQL